MKTLLKRIIVGVLLSASLVVDNVCYGDSEGVADRKKAWNEIRWKVGQITIVEGKIIKQIEDVCHLYNRMDGDEREATLDVLGAIYREHKGAFLELVVLDNLASLNELGILPDSNARFLAFAKKMPCDVKDVVAFLNAVKDPGQKRLLKSWYVARTDHRKLPQEFSSMRSVRVKQIRRQIQNKSTDPNSPRIDALFDIVENRKNPLEYEAVLPLILNMYRKYPEAVVRHLEQLLIKYAPTQVPPPYGRKHTLFHELCFVTMVVSDKNLVDIMTTFSKSHNPYVSIKASVALNWLQEGVKYPIQYEVLKLAYESSN